MKRESFRSRYGAILQPVSRTINSDGKVGRNIRMYYQRLSAKRSAIRCYKRPLACPGLLPNALLRAPSDLDFLIELQDLPLTQRVLEMAGYHPKVSSGIDLKFWKPSPKMPTASDNPCSVSTEPLVELHLGFWESDHQIP